MDELLSASKAHELALCNLSNLTQFNYIKQSIISSMPQGKLSSNFTDVLSSTNYQILISLGYKVTYVKNMDSPGYSVSW
jgi:hypothetical protein